MKRSQKLREGGGGCTLTTKQGERVTTVQQASVYLMSSEFTHKYNTSRVKKNECEYMALTFCSPNVDFLFMVT